ncbi:MAG TPA: hypothetical protein VFB20_07360 [Burkholderiales bacterium]|nr:hypothetical protein [Burkholderiales bacterium]
MIRRRIVKAALAIAGAALLSGHSPYRQWYAYRGKHLIVVASVADAEASRLADALAARLAAELPESHAVSAQAKSAREVVQLLRSRQLPAAVLDMQTAGVAYAGRPPFEREGPLELRKLAEFERHLLVVLDDFPEDKAFAIAGAAAVLGQQRLPEAPKANSQVSAIPLHPGALAFRQAHESHTGR